MVSKREIANSIDSIRDDISLCWDVFTDAKSMMTKPGEDRGRQIIQLQVDLIRILSRLDRIYRNISSEKKELLSNKPKYNYDWFVKRIKSLDECLKAVIETIGIAKTIGDGYAWIFYGDDNDLIDEHAKLQRQVMLPPGVGGIGERAFVEKVQGNIRSFVLYHGITSILRLGDVSFIDPAKGRVRSVGELKTRKLGQNTYQITVGCVGDSKFDLLNLSAQSAVREQNAQERKNAEPRLSEKIQRSLNRQMTQLADALGRQNVEGSKYKCDTIGDYYFQSLEGLVERTGPHKMEAEKVSSGLLVTALRIPKGQRNPLRAPKGDAWPGKRVKGIEEHVKTILDGDLEDNCIIIGNLIFDNIGFPNFRPGALPIMWWPIKQEVLKDIIFGNVVVNTIHNPAHFWQLMRGRGFDVEVDKRSRLVCARRTVGKVIQELRELEHFMYLARCHLVSEDTIMSMIDLSLEHIEELGPGLHGKVRIKPVVRLRS